MATKQEFYVLDECLKCKHKCKKEFNICFKKGNLATLTICKKFVNA